MVAHVTASQSGVWSVTASGVTLHTTWFQGDAINWARNYLRVRGGGQLVVYRVDGMIDQQQTVPSNPEVDSVQGDSLRTVPIKR